jgi:hypothetical protein
MESISPFTAPGLALGIFFEPALSAELIVTALSQASPHDPAAMFAAVLAGLSRSFSHVQQLPKGGI